MMFSNASGVVTSAVVRTISAWLLVVRRAGRGIEGDGRQRVAQIGDREAEARELCLIDVDAENLVAIAIDLHVGDARHGGQLVDDLVLDDQRHVLDGHGVGGHGEPHDGIGIGVRLDDARRIRLVGQLVGDAADRVAHVGGGDVQIDAVVELDGDAAVAEGRGRRDRLDAGDARDRALDHTGQLAVDGLGGGAFESLSSR